MRNTIEPKNSVVFFIYTKQESEENESNLPTKLLALPNRRLFQSCTSKVQKSDQDLDGCGDRRFAAGGSIRIIL